MPHQVPMHRTSLLAHPSMEAFPHLEDAQDGAIVGFGCFASLSDNGQFCVEFVKGMDLVVAHEGGLAITPAYALRHLARDAVFAAWIMDAEDLLVQELRPLVESMAPGCFPPRSPEVHIYRIILLRGTGCAVHTEPDDLYQECFPDQPFSPVMLGHTLRLLLPPRSTVHADLAAYRRAQAVLDHFGPDVAPTLCEEGAEAFALALPATLTGRA